MSQSPAVPQRPSKLLEDVLDGRVVTAMALQPIRDLLRKREFGHEALFRMPGKVDASPAQLWKDAEAAGMIEPLENLVARLCSALPVRPSLPRLFVNVHPASIGTVDRWRRLARVVVEIPSEGGVPQELAVSLREAHMPFAVDLREDDPRRLRELMTIRPDYLKLGRALTANCHLETQRADHLSLICAYAREAGATVIAEGVELASEAGTLLRVGVTFAQGFWLGKPHQFLN